MQLDLKQKLAEIREKQQQILREYDAVVKEYESSDLVNENVALKKNIVVYEQELSGIKTELVKNLRENERLRLALQEQICNERLNILKISRQKLKTYFEDRSSEYQNSLTELEVKTKEQLTRLAERAKKHLGQDQTAFAERIAQLTIELERQLQSQAFEFQNAQDNLWQDVKTHMDQMGESEVSPEVIQKRIQQNQLEMKIGLEWVNRIGILLILLGVGAAFQYSFVHWMNNYLKGIFFFILGGLFLSGGEWCYRRGKKVFAKGLIGGGSAILYGSIFYSYFLLKIIPLEIGMGLAGLVTLTTVVLSLRYHSKTICSIGLIGGFLPFVSYVSAFGLTGAGYVVAMGYLFMLNLIILLISFWKRWIEINYLSFLFNIPALVFLVFTIPNWRIGLAFSVGTFLMYLVVTLAYPILHKIALKSFDVVLAGLNMAVCSLIVFGLLHKGGLLQHRGLAALIFCIAFLGLGRVLHKVLPKEKGTLVLFYSAALTFAILVIPFQFGIQWLALGWLIEAILLIIYGYKIKAIPMEISGWGIFTLCLCAFGFCDFLPAYIFNITIPYLDFKYFTITAGELAIMIYYLRQMNRNQISRFSIRGSNIVFYKNLTFVSLFIYLLFSFHRFFYRWAPPELHPQFYYNFCLALIMIGLGYFMSKIKMLSDGFIKGFVILQYLTADVICLGLNISFPVLDAVSGNSVARYGTLGILLGFNIFVFFNLRDLLLQLIRRKSGNLEIVPLLMAVFLSGNVTAFLIVQFQLGSLNLLISFIYLALAIGYIGYGFGRKYAYIRRFGLGLTLFSIAKLFLYDLSYLESYAKIIAYFGFGLILLAISFIYQKIKNNLEGQHDSKSA